MRNSFRRLAPLLVMLFITWCATIAHLGIPLPPRKITAQEAEKIPTGEANRWIAKSEFGIHQAILSGPAFERGIAWGRFTRDLLERQEEVLVEQFQGFFPSRFVQWGLLLAVKRWFWGMSDFLEPEWLEEMQGVSFSASPKFASYGDPYARQLAYHALHEIGQMFVDYGPPNFACTVLAVPQEKNWLIGRNFDFEGGRIFDDEKIMKWVFPEEGIPFVSVIWAGMVGAVTGVNQKGVFISINAAGSSDFGRLGTPSTLIILKALQTARSGKEAVEIFRRYQTIITEIFVVAAPEEPLYVIEKSPHRMQVLEYANPHAVSNHLVHPSWNSDSVNSFRQTELTSQSRLARAENLLAKFSKGGAREILAGLRDKTPDGAGSPLFGNRGAIDAQIATHAVVYDSKQGILYVGKGPSLVGEFLGFDLNASFARREPVKSPSLPADKDLSPAFYAKLKADEKIFQAALDPTNEDCASLEKFREPLQASFAHYQKFIALARIAKYCGPAAAAEKFRQEALSLHPAYARERRELQEPR